MKSPNFSFDAVADETVVLAPPDVVVVVVVDEGSAKSKYINLQN